MSLHTINRQCFEVVCPTEAMAADLQDRLALYTAPSMTDILSDLLDEDFAGREYGVIDRLEIDLGEISYNELESAALLERFRSILAERLGAILVPVTLPFAKRRPGDSAGGHAPQAPESVDLTGEAEWELIRVFLLAGCLPWWADRSEQPDMDRLLNTIIRQDPDRAALFFKDLIDHTGVQKRLQTQCRPGTRRLVAQALGAGPAAGELKSVYHKRATHKAQQERLLDRLLSIPPPRWMAALRWVGVADHAHGHGRQEMRRRLKKLSGWQLLFLLAWAELYAPAAPARRPSSAKVPLPVSSPYKPNTSSPPAASPPCAGETLSTAALAEYDSKAGSAATAAMGRDGSRKAAITMGGDPGSRDGGNGTEFTAGDSAGVRKGKGRGDEGDGDTGDALPARSQQTIHAQVLASYIARRLGGSRESLQTLLSGWPLKSLLALQKRGRAQDRAPVAGPGSPVTKKTGDRHRDLLPPTTQIPTNDQQASPRPAITPTIDLQDLSRPGITPTVDQHTSATPGIIPTVDRHTSAKPVITPTNEQQASPKPVITPTIDQQDLSRPGITPTVDQHTSATPGIIPTVDQHTSAKPAITPTNEQQASPKPVITPTNDQQDLPTPGRTPTIFQQVSARFGISPAIGRQASPRPGISPANDQWVTSKPAISRFLPGNAGLCLLAPFLPHLYNRIRYTKNGRFVDSRRAGKAACLLQYIATGQTRAPEYLLPFNKLLCGLPVEEPLAEPARLTKTEKQEADAMLEAVIANWIALKHTSIHGLRGSFLCRDGILEEQSGDWTLQVERKDYDILLNAIPWAYSIIKLPWMQKHLTVTW